MIIIINNPEKKTHSSCINLYEYNSLGSFAGDVVALGLGDVTLPEKRKRKETYVQSVSGNISNICWILE